MKLTRSLLGVALASAFTYPAQSAERFWNTSHFFGFLCNGNFNNIDCWGPGGNPAPGNLDAATWNFAHASSRAVSFQADLFNQKARIRNDNILWDLNGKTYTLTQDNSVTDPSLAIGINNGETGRLTIRNGVVNSARSVLAINGSSSGFLTVTGGTTTFNAGSGLTVGYWEYTQAGVNVLGGARLTSSGSTAIGFHATASGSATVSGPGSKWTTSGDISVGSASGGRGSLAAHDDGRVVAGALTVWNSASSISAINPAAAGGGILNIAGKLGLNAGARATSRFAIVDTVNAVFGTVAGGILAGSATIRGAGSSWETEFFTSGAIAAGSTTVGSGGKLQIAGDTLIGQLSGSNGLLVIESNGTVQTAGDASIGRDVGSQGSATLGGTGASWSVAGDLQVGGSAAGSGGTGMIAVASGAKLNAGNLTVWNANSSIRTGDAAPFQGGTIEVAGELTLRDGGKASSFNGIVDSVPAGIVVGIYAARASIAGPGSVWDTTQFYTGLNGTGTTTVSEGGMVKSSGNTIVGLNTSSSGLLHIKAGGRVDTGGNGYIGFGEGATGTARVDGDGASWGVTGTLFVGGAGTLSVEDGARVETNQMTVLNGASRIDTTAFGGGSLNVVGALRLQPGARATSRFAVVDTIGAVFSTLPGGILAGSGAIQGADALWQTDYFAGGALGEGTMTVGGGGTLRVGYDSIVGQLSGSSGTLLIEALGAVQVGGDAMLGRDGGSQGKTTIIGSGASLDVAGRLHVGGGPNGSGGTGILTVGIGARANAGNLTVWNGDSRIDTGAPSPFAGGAIDVAGTLTLRDGGTASSYYGVVGNNRPGTANSIGAGKLVIEGEGSRWDTWLFTIDHAGQNDAASISDGGTLRSGSDAVIGLSYSPWQQTLFIDAGGSMETGGNGLIGTVAGSSGGVYVGGNHARWSVDQSLQIGQDISGGARPAELWIGQGGVVDVADMIKLQDSGFLTMAGGTLNAKFMDIRGLVQFDGGTINVQEDLAYNIGPRSPGIVLGATDTLNVGGTTTMAGLGAFHLDGGTLSTGSFGVLRNFTFLSGHLQLTRDDLVVGTGSLTGNDLLLDAARTVSVTNQVSVNSGASLRILGGTFSAGSYANDGHIQLVGPAASAVGGSFTNNGMVQLSAGSITLDRELTNGTTGSVTGHGTLQTQAGLANAGTLVFSGTTAVHGSVHNTAGGAIAVAGQITTFHDGVVHDGAAFDIVGGAAAVFLGRYSGTGNFTGAGALHFAGPVFPGNSPALVSVEGDMTLLGSAVTTMELGGRARGSLYDAFDVGATLLLGGTLTVTLLDLGDGVFQPQAGDSFDLFAASTLQGRFGTANFAALDPSLAWNIAYLTDAIGATDIVRVSVTAVPEPHTWLMLFAGLSLIGSVAQRNRPGRG